MRNFNSHLSDDSETTGLGSSVKTIGKFVDMGKSLLGKDTEEAGGSVHDPEYSLKSIIKQAHEYTTVSYDPVDSFFRNNKASLSAFEQSVTSALTDTPKGPIYHNLEDQYNTGYNNPHYVLNSYKFKAGVPVFGKAAGKHTLSGTLVHGYISMFNAGTVMVDYTDKKFGTFHFRDIEFREDANEVNRLQNSCTIDEIVKNPVGQARFFYEDFMYCAELGTLSNNHLICLRKFATAIGDNIFYGSGNTDAGDAAGTNYNLIPQDTARLVCFFGGKDNKLEDILKMDFNATWKEFTGEFQQQDTNTDNDSSGSLGMLANLMSPSYAKGVASGVNKGGGDFITSLLGSHYQNRLGSEYRRVKYGQYDQHKIYTPKNIINKTNYYEGKMNFNNSFTLTFRYKMRSYNDINQKAAFLDLLSNILNVTYRRATFWGGAVNWMGTPQNSKPFKTANALLDKVFSKAGGVWNSLFNGGGASFLESAGEWLADIFSSGDSVMQAVKDGANAAVEAVKNFGEKYGPKGKKMLQSLGNNGIDILKGAMKNRLGRPQVYALNSILNSDNTGYWHVTIGNPFNPIVSMGNLIIDKVELQHSGALNIDDFPEEIIVRITLKHGKPRDITAISKMYTQGLGELYVPMSKGTVEKFASGTNAVSARAEAIEMLNSLDSVTIDNTGQTYAQRKREIEDEYVRKVEAAEQSEKNNEGGNG